jgi:predicted deacetylase
MPLPEGASRGVAVAIHDVSPATLGECRDLMGMLDEIGATPISLLVVPHFHYHARIDDAFVAAMDARRARGDELILHGCFHIDEAPPPRTLRGVLERRVATRSEGEFAALTEDAAAWRLARGIELFRRHRWPLAGFVPPAWLLSPASRAAIAHCSHPFEYVTVRTGIYHLPDWRFEATANLWYSPDSGWRRAVSRLAIAHELRRARKLSLLRISLHPQDVRGKGVLAHWRSLIGEAIGSRTPVTKGQWVRSVRPRRGRQRGVPTRAFAGGRENVSPARGAF